MKEEVERALKKIEDAVEQDTQWLTRDGQDAIKIKIEELRKEVQKRYK